MKSRRTCRAKWGGWLARERVAGRVAIRLWLALMLVTAGSWAGRAESPPSQYSPGELLVAFRAGAGPGVLPAPAGTQKPWVAEEIPQLGVWRVAVEPGRELVMAEAWRTLPGVAYVEPNYRAWAVGEPPNDPLYVLQWNLDTVRAPDAWERARGDPATPIAIIDTGIDLLHPDLVGKLWVNPGEIPGNGLDDDQDGYVDDVHGYDFVNQDGDPNDDHGHGTHVAGIAAAATDNSVGVAGMAPDSPLMALKVLDRDGGGYYKDIALAIDYARARGVRVMNLSLAGSDDSAVLYQSVEAATSAGAVVVAAAGNNQTGSNPFFYPAAYPEAFAVGATDRYDGIAYFSAHHPYVDVTAPGSYIYSTSASALGYGIRSGTSMAAPHVAGLAALVWASDPALPREEVERRIASGAVDLGSSGKDDYYGWGRIDARATLCESVPPLTVSPPSVAFLAGQVQAPVPPSRTVRLASGCSPLIWSLTISPSLPGWLHISPTTGTVPADGSGTVSIEVDPTDLGAAYGDYASRARFSAADGSAEGVVEVRLRYIPRIHRVYLALFVES